MPGVPSGRGCEACRKQKKKCDQVVPACSRCARLGIPCAGSGQQRYKFLDQTQALHTLAGQPGDHDATGSLQLRRSTPPGNELSALTGSLVYAMGVTDARFDLTVYGYFLEEIPSRLGTNPALDASVRSLTVAFSSLLNRQRDVNQAELLQSYNETLRCLRGCLSDPATAQAPETMCAVYLTMVCQGWIGRRGDFLPSHGEAIAHLLNAAAESGSLSPDSAFETGMVATLGMIVTLESFVNPSLKLDPRVLAFARPSGPRITVQDAFDIPSLRLGALTRTAQLIRRASTSTGTSTHEEPLSQIRSAYEQTQNDCVTMKAALSQAPWQQQRQEQQQLPSQEDDIFANVVRPVPLSVSETRFHVRMQSCYGILLTLATMLLSVLQEASEQQQPKSNSNQHDASLTHESTACVDEVIRLAQQAEKYRPLGSSGTPLSLITAWSVTNDAGRQAALERLIGNYQSDFPSANWLAVAYLIKPKLQ